MQGMTIKRFAGVIQATFLLALLSVSMALPACTTPQTPPPDTAGGLGPQATNVNCASQILQEGISQAVSRSNTIIAAGPSKTVVKKNLLGLVADLTAPVVACGLQYLTGKLAFDASHAQTDDVKADYEKRAAVAREFISEQGYTFAGAPPN